MSLWNETEPATKAEAVAAFGWAGGAAAGILCLAAAVRGTDISWPLPAWFFGWTIFYLGAANLVSWWRHRG